MTDDIVWFIMVFFYVVSQERNGSLAYVSGHSWALREVKAGADPGATLLTVWLSGSCLARLLI